MKKTYLFSLLLSLSHGAWAQGETLFYSCQPSSYEVRETQNTNSQPVYSLNRRTDETWEEVAVFSPRNRRLSDYQTFEGVILKVQNDQRPRYLKSKQLTISGLSGVGEVNCSVPVGPCGISGTFEERLKDCALKRNGGFLALGTTKEGVGVHLDLNSGLYWTTTTVAQNLRFQQAMAKCQSLGNFEGASWRLPTLEEFKAAYKREIHHLLPQMKDFFWVTTETNDWPYIFNGAEGWWDNEYFQDAYGRDFWSVRCVAQ